MRVAVWAPRPPSPSGIADYADEQCEALAAHCEVVRVGEDDPAPEADLRLYHVGNSPAHVYVYREALRTPGVVVLHEWSLHHLVLGETVEAGDVGAYLRQMRRAHGPTGTLVGRQIARGLGGDLLPALFPLADSVLERSLAVVGLTRHVTTRAASRVPGRPVLHLPHHVCLPLDPPPGRDEARAALGLPPDVPILCAPGLGTAAKRLEPGIRAAGRLRAQHPGLLFVVAGEPEFGLPLAEWAWNAGLGDGLIVTGRVDLADFERHVAAADVVLSLRFPTHGEISGALVRALGVGRPALVTAGTPAAEEFPPGVVVPVDPGVWEETELLGLLGHLIAHPALRDGMGAVAREHVLAHHDLGATTARLARFLAEVDAGAPALRALVEAESAEPEGLLGYYLEEVRWAARDLGVPGLALGVQDRLREIAR